MNNKEKEVKEVEVHEAEPINVLSTIKASQLIDVSTWKEKQLKLVAENPFFKIIDSKTYEAGKKHRTNVVKGRTELQNQEKLVASTFATIRKEVGTETATLIEITQPLEDEWQSEVKSWEERKATEKKEAEDAENLRIKTITDKIDKFEADSYVIIQGMQYSEIISKTDELSKLDDTEFDFEEYDILYEQAKDRITVALESKIGSLTASENQRLDNVRLELQSNRLLEIMPYVAFGEPIDLTKLSEMTEDEYSLVFNTKKSLSETKSKEAQEKEEEEKEAIYVIREKRLLELGMQYSDEHDTFFIDAENEYILLKEDIRDFTAVEFEDTFEEVKTVFKEASDKVEKERVFGLRKNILSAIGFDVEKTRSGFFIHPDLFDGIDADALFNLDKEWFESKFNDAKLALEKVKSDAKEAEAQKEKDLQLAKEDAERLKKENKARIKKYAGDKKALTEFVKSLEFRNAVPELQNEDMQPVLDKILLELENSRGFLLTEINLF